MSSIIELMEQRTSASAYDPSRTLTQDQIKKLIHTAGKAPSAFNLQNWRVIAVTSDSAKQRLHPLAFQQPKVLDAAVTFIVCGTLNEHKTIRSALEPTLSAGIIDQATYEGWVGAAQGMYADNPAMQRDEAIRSGALLAMSLMLVAQGEGLVSCPMIGFDPAGVASEFQLTQDEIPVMLVTVGYSGEGNWPQKPRKAVDEILTLV